MGEEFYAAIKLVSGEEVFSLVSIDENEGDPIVILQNPVKIKIFENNYGSVCKIKPWMEIPEDEFFLLKLDKIITITEINDFKTINLYKTYLNEDVEEECLDGNVKITKEMVYVSSVDKARETLEKIYKDPKES